jgi:hypothetical protein
MLIFTEHNTPRLRYVLDFIFREGFGMDFRITGDPEEFRAEEGPKISYSDLRSGDPGTGYPGTGDPDSGDPGTGDALRIPASGLLAETGVSAMDPGLNKNGSVPVLFTAGPDNPSPNRTDNLQHPGNAGTDFDLFAAVFYMISRYEEYLPFEGDRYGRFPAGESLAGKHGFLEMPVVDLWLEDLREKLKKRFRNLQLASAAFQFQPTCDIDLPFAFLHRGMFRTLGAGIRAGLKNGPEQRQLRRQVLGGEAKDPFDTYSEMETIHSRHGVRPKIFFLTAKYGKYDKSISPKSAAFRELVKQSMNYADVGIHPSFRASDSPAELQREVRMLTGITEQKISRSRQHYLRFSLPGSYQDYLAAGIREEYSMGFASAAGFRAGTARPFFFYDLLKEEVTPLRVFPFQVMDRTLKDYMKLDPRQAMERILSLADAVRKTGGTFSSIWHNDAFSDYGEWNGWKDVYLQMMEALLK